MSRTTLLQERRMKTFQNVLGHWQARRLSALEAAEMLGMSERSFRRYRRRYEDDGLDGLFDRRLDKASARRVPAPLLHLVGFGVSPTALQVDDFDNSFCVEKVVASAHALLESQIQHQGSQIGEADICIGPSADDRLQQSLMQSRKHQALALRLLVGARIGRRSAR